MHVRVAIRGVEASRAGFALGFRAGYHRPAGLGVEQRQDFQIAGIPAPVLAADLRNGTDLTASLFSDRAALYAWRPRWMARLGDARATADAMDRVNPLYIPRNHLVEEALGAATNDADFAPFEDLLSIVTRPFEAQPGKDRFALPAPEDFGPYTTFCGT